MTNGIVTIFIKILEVHFGNSVLDNSNWEINQSLRKKTKIGTECNSF